MIVAFVLGAFGALAAEILQRWKQFNDIPEDRFRLMLRTLKFWSAALFLVLLGGIGGLLAVSDSAKVDWKVCFLGGVGAMALVRNTLSGAAAQAEPRRRKVLRSPEKSTEVPSPAKLRPSRAEEKAIMLADIRAGDKRAGDTSLGDSNGGDTSGEDTRVVEDPAAVLELAGKETREERILWFEEQLEEAERQLKSEGSRVFSAPELRRREVQIEWVRWLHAERDRLEAELQPEEQERLAAVRRQREEQERLAAERWQREEQERLAAERRQREEITLTDLFN